MVGGEEKRNDQIWVAFYTLPRRLEFIQKENGSFVEFETGSNQVDVFKKCLGSAMEDSLETRMIASFEVISVVQERHGNG